MRVLLDADKFSKTIFRMADDIARLRLDFKQVALVGIHRRGIPIATRLAEALKLKKLNVLQGMLDINLYRYDLSEVAEHPVIRETRIDFPVDGKHIFIVDDVLYTGRTARAALNAIFDLGRPAAVYLVVVAKRNGRELPIEANICGVDVATQSGDNVKVMLKEIDGEDGVKLAEGGS
jgi:pyrimidine operon attenuation protein/uracil phosphoribosyltransferase